MQLAARSWIKRHVVCGPCITATIFADHSKLPMSNILGPAAKYSGWTNTWRGPCSPVFTGLLYQTDRSNAIRIGTIFQIFLGQGREAYVPVILIGKSNGDFQLNCQCDRLLRYVSVHFAHFIVVVESGAALESGGPWCIFSGRPLLPHFSK